MVWSTLSPMEMCSFTKQVNHAVDMQILEMQGKFIEDGWFRRPGGNRLLFSDVPESDSRR